MTTCRPEQAHTVHSTSPRRKTAKRDLYPTAIDASLLYRMILVQEWWKTLPEPPSRIVVLQFPHRWLHGPAIVANLLQVL